MAFIRGFLIWCVWRWIKGAKYSPAAAAGQLLREFIVQIYGCDFAARPGGGCCLRFWFIILLSLHTAENILFAARNPKHPHIRRCPCPDRN